MPEEELAKELEARDTAEIIDGVVCQVTQALDESENEVKFLLYGELRMEEVIPIEKVCAKCDFWKDRFKDIKACQERQAKDAKARGFNKVICPKQFK